MSLMLDSALLDDARASAALGLAQAGITTNPTLLARTGQPAEKVIPALCDAHPGIIFHQLAAPTVAGPVENVWGSPNGLSIQTFDIYIDQDGAGSGARLMLPGRNAVRALASVRQRGHPAGWLTGDSAYTNATPEDFQSSSSFL